MTDTITLTGLVATAPKLIVTSEGLSITSFRLASAQRRFDRSHQRWIDGDTNWYTVTAFRQLAMNASTSVIKGDRVVVTGRLRIRDWANGEKTGTNIDVEADAIGHDLAWGTSVFRRSISSSSAPAAESAATTPESGAAAPQPEAQQREDGSSATTADEARESVGEPAVALAY